MSIKASCSVYTAGIGQSEGKHEYVQSNTHHSNRSLNFVIVHIGPQALDHQFSLALLAVHTLQIWQVFAADCDSSDVLQT